MPATAQVPSHQVDTLNDAEILGVRDIAAMCCVTVRTISRWAANGVLPAIIPTPLGKNKLRWHRAIIEKWRKAEYPKQLGIAFISNVIDSQCRRAVTSLERFAQSQEFSTDLKRLFELAIAFGNNQDYLPGDKLHMMIAVMQFVTVNGPGPTVRDERKSAFKMLMSALRDFDGKIELIESLDKIEGTA